MQTLRAPRATLLVLATLALSALAACDANGRINGSVHVAPGEQAGEVSTVNGAVEVGERASVAGMHTVNGHLSLGESARAGSMRTVNGAVEIAAMAQVTANVATVNGALNVGQDAQVGGTLENINGPITVDGAHVVGRLRTVNGAISILNGARVDGGILVQKPHGIFIDLLHDTFHSTRSSALRVVIGRDVSIGGTLKFEREVKLYVSDQVKHLGPIEGATPIRYSGDSPPL